MNAPEVPEELSFRVRLRTRWSDEDNHGVLNNAVYLTLFEEGRHAYFRGLGQLDENRFPFVLLQTDVRYLRPGRGAAEVEVELGTTALGRSSFQQAYRVRAVDDGEVWCEAEALLVTIDAASGRGRRMPDAFRGAIAAFEGLTDQNVK